MKRALPINSRRFISGETCGIYLFNIRPMGFPGIGNNPMVGCTVACAVDVAQALSK